MGRVARRGGDPAVTYFGYASLVTPHIRVA